MKSFIVAAVAAFSLAGAAAAQVQTTPGKRNHTPRIGKTTAQSTGATPARIKRASGGGVPHGPRTGSGKVVPSKSAAKTGAR